MHSLAQEIEIKLELEPADVPLLFQEPPFARAETHSTQQVTFYYDTPKTVLKKHGLTLRVRETGGRFIQTIKSGTQAAGLISRDEIEYEVTDMAPNFGPLGEHPVRELLEDAEPLLSPVLRSDVIRTTTVLERSGTRIRLDVDTGMVGARGRTDEFAEVELELLGGTTAGLIIAARRLSEHVPVRLGVLTKAERGFRLAQGRFGKVSKASTVDVHHSMTVAEAFEVIVHACLKHYRLNEPLVIRESKAEALHQCRVAMRRLRAAFSMFKPAVEDIEFQHLRHELRWFTSQLGEARNLDVYLRRDLTTEERARSAEQRERAYVLVADAMNSHRFRRLLIDIVGWTAIGTWRNAKSASRPVLTFANARLDKLWHSVATAGRDIAAMDESMRHGLRIQVKKMRYAVEFLHGLYPNEKKAQRQFAAAIEALQESLGKLNDIATARVLGSVPATDSWLIGSYEERGHMKAANEDYRDLLSIGRFWRRPEDAAHKNRVSVGADGAE